ncbi:formate dehydrogenase [Frankia nepalensis]|uniref:formate dehydrogenase n=1 Tax=Frankia nepalensis TaxID=1836974 RepID=UPI0027DB2AC3|nr:formate dehydrogenase [Frankia nepalensis]
MSDERRPAARHGEIRRFGPGTRWVHRLTAVLFGTCLATAAILYLPPLSLMVGRRALVMTIHLYAGYALPVPALVGWLVTGFRRDVTELNRFTAADGAWLRDRSPVGPPRRHRDRAGTPPTEPTEPTEPTGPGQPGEQPADQPGVGGKFNAGQKLYAAAVAGSMVVFLGTGLVMWFGADLRIPDRYRTGATFIHDLFAIGIFFAVLGHFWMALRDPEARAGLRTGYVPTWWAATEHPRWAPRPERSDGPEAPEPRSEAP